MYPMTGTDIFVRIPDDSGKRELIPGQVTASDEKSITIRLELELDLADGQELFVHYEIDRKFMQQPVQVELLGEPENVEDITFLVTGEPFSAESREHYRVTSISANALVDVGSEPGCMVLDVSGTGFSFYAQALYESGRSLEVRFSFDGKQWPGTIVIMSVKDMRGKMRYGVRCTDGPLKNAMGSICLGVERQQLQRLASHETSVTV